MDPLLCSHPPKITTYFKISLVSSQYPYSNNPHQQGRMSERYLLSCRPQIDYNQWIFPVDNTNCHLGTARDIVEDQSAARSDSRAWAGIGVRILPVRYRRSGPE